MTLEKSYQKPQIFPLELFHQNLYVRLSFGHLKKFCHFDVAPTIGHIIYYRKGGSGSFPSLGHGVSCELACWWLICATCWLQLLLITFFWVCAN